MEESKQHTSPQPNPQRYNQPPPYYYEDDEITLKELILKMQEYWRYWRSKWVWIAAASVIGAALGFLKYSLTPVTYSSYLSFTVEEEGKTTSLEELYGLGGPQYNLNKITELAKSSRIINPVILKMVSIDGEEDYLGNHVIKLFGLDKQWEKEGGKKKFQAVSLADYQFSNDDIENFTQRDHRALNVVKGKLAGNALSKEKGVVKIEFSKITEIFELTTEVENEELSIILNNEIYNSLRENYIHEKIEQPREILAKLEITQDSLQQVVNSLEGQLIGVRDRQQGIFGSSTKMREQKISSELLSVNAQFGQVKKNVEVIKFTLENKRPAFQIVEQRYIPRANRASMVKLVGLGLFMGLFLSLLTFFFNKIFFDALYEKSKSK